MSIIHLPDRGVVKVVGDDARTFLNGLVTCDMGKVAPDRSGYGALLSPQGKILFDFLIAEAEPADGGGFFLDCPRALAPDLMKRLNLYKLRAKVICEDLSDVLGVGVVIGASTFDAGDYLGYADPRLPALGMRLIGERNRLAALGGTTSPYHAHRIALGVPEGGKDFAYADAFPHEALMDQLNGVDFRKGCYVGQEVVSRMEHRGTARSRIVRVAYPGGFGPDAGAEVMAGDKVIGRAGSNAAGYGLALVRLDRLGEALQAGAAVTAGGVPLVAERPDFVQFEVPTA